MTWHGFGSANQHTVIEKLYAGDENQKMSARNAFKNADEQILGRGRCVRGQLSYSIEYQYAR